MATRTRTCTEYRCIRCNGLLSGKTDPCYRCSYDSQWMDTDGWHDANPPPGWERVGRKITPPRREITRTVDG